MGFERRAQPGDLVYVNSLLTGYVMIGLVINVVARVDGVIWTSLVLVQNVNTGRLNRKIVAFDRLKTVHSRPEMSDITYLDPTNV